jgi:hypothetical protein
MTSIFDGKTYNGTFGDDGTPGLSLGLRFAINANGFITGVKYYRNASDTAQGNTRIGYLWDDDTGALLASATFVNDDANTPGWKTATFTSPVAVTTGVNYIASYGTTNNYSATVNYFTTANDLAFDGVQDNRFTEPTGNVFAGIDNGSLLVNANTTLRPTDFSPNDANYWVDVDWVDTVGFNPDPWGATVATENANTGNPLPTITGAGDANVQGFARGFSANVNTTINFAISVNTGTSTDRVDIYRIGWYGGAGARKIAEISNTDTLQAAATTIADSNGATDCDAWTDTASWAIPLDAMSGLFVAVPIVGGSAVSWIPFVVRDDSRVADVLVKTSESTWGAAYNKWGSHANIDGGKSLYGGPDTAFGSITDRSLAVSLHRPIMTRDIVPQTYWTYAEQPLILFLERNGIDVAYIASKDLDQISGILDTTKVFISSGHDEYWSQAMWDAVLTFRGAGGHTIFMSGNEILWRTRHDATNPHIIWCYKDTMPGPGAHVAGDPFDPITWTGTWRDTRRPGGAEGENLLSGTFFRMNGVNYFDVVIDSATYGNSPFWRSTTVATGTDATLTDCIGMEADEAAATRTGNNVAYLAQEGVTLTGIRADDNGQNYNGSGAMDWRIVAQRYDGGGTSWGFGTVTWAWLLQAEHEIVGGKTGAVSTPARQATLNLLTDLTGTAPATTMAGLSTPTPTTIETYFTMIIDATTYGFRVYKEGVGWMQVIAPGGITGGGDALTSNPLSQFAATTSAQLASVISDETGTGALVFGTAPTITLPNATGLPISTGISGLGTGIAAALAINTGSAGAPVLLNGAGGTPSSLALTNATGLPWGAGITDKPTTLSGYGITDAQPLDSDLTAIAALTTTADGRSLLTATALTTAGLGLTNGAAIDTIGANGSAFYLARANHTGTQAGSTVTGAYTAAGLTMATASLLGRTTASAGAAEEISIGTGLSLTAGTLSATGGGGGYPDDNYAIPGGVLEPQATGPTIEVLTSATNGIEQRVATFSGVTTQTANFSDARPKNWDGSDPTARFRFRAAAGATGAATFAIAITAINEGDVVDVAPTFVQVNDALVTAGRDQLTDATAAIPIQGTLQANSRLQFWIRRNKGDAADTMSANCHLISTIITFASA